jgi:hypothetical protein
LNTRNMHWMGLLRVVVFGLALTLSACTVAQAGRPATPTRTVPDLGPSAQPPLDAADPSAAIEQAMLDSLRAQGAPTENAKIVVQKIADGYARVAVYYDVVRQPTVWDLGFAHFEDGAWKAWAFGSGIAQEHVEAAGIPRSVWPDGWLTVPLEGDNCPETTADTRLLKNTRHGYCLLYPAGYKVEKPSEIETDLVVGSLLNAEDPRVSIRVEDAGGRTADELAKQITDDLGAFPIERSSIVLGNVEAIVLDKLPGQDINRQVLFEHDGLLYQLTFWPADENIGDAYARMEAMYGIILDSFAFIPASNEVVPGEDCLEAKSDTQPLTFEAYNFCMLYPTGYDVDEPTENQIVLFVGSLLDVAHPQVFIEIQDAARRTAEQIADELVAEVQGSIPGYNVERSFGLTVGYEPAWVLENMPGQEISRQVIVVHDGRLYKLTFVPADEQAGEAYTQMESLYTTVINSFRFLR